MGLDQPSPTQDKGEGSGGVTVSCFGACLAFYEKGFMLAISNYQATN